MLVCGVRNICLDTIMVLIIAIASSTQRADCVTGSVRLANQIKTATTVEGRVEVCINQAWGTVCNTRFDPEDAGTVCVVAGGFRRNGMRIIMCKRL